MTKFENKSKIATIALILVLTLSAVIVALPVSARDPPVDVPTVCYAYVTNDIIGVNQPTVVVYWINAVPPTAVGDYGDRWTFTVEVTKSDGSKVTLGPFESDPIGGGWAQYTPTEIGTYTLVAKMAEHKITGLPVPPGGYFFGSGISINDTYLASTSDPMTLIVQEEPIVGWQETPLPTEYWIRPITNANRDWWQLAGNWLAGAAQNVGPTTRFSYGKGPESAHIMWSTQMWAGGVMDGRFGNYGYVTGHYEGTDFVPPIILNGKIYYNVMSLPREGYRVLDLYTGEELWFQNSTGPVSGTGGGFDFSGELAVGRLSFGQIYNYDSPNQHGGLPYLWSTSGPDGTWMMYDSETGNYICSINNIPQGMGFFGPSTAGTAVYGKDGSLLQYILKGTPNPAGFFFPDVAPFYLQVWNTSRAIWYEETWNSNEYWMWRPTLNQTFDGNNGYSLNVTIPTVQGSIRAVREDEYVIGGTSGKNNGTYIQKGNLWALSLVEGQEGTLLWNITFTPPQSPPDIQTGMFGGMSGPNVDPEDGIFHFSEPVTRTRWGYDLVTGQQIWGPTAPEAALHFYGLSTNVYDGKLYSGGFGGVLIAYDIKTGEILWNYTSTQIGFESPYGNYPIAITAIADGKIYTITGEHSITQPMWRGPNLRCIDADTGEELWKISFFGANGGASLGGTYVVMADGYVVGLNQYDSKIYCFGKGPSQTAVAVQNDVVSWGDSVLIKGSVIDLAAGTKQLEQAARFPNGVPAIADEDQEGWMEYVYMQQSKPTDAQGVDVSIDVIDANGNTRNIGNATSDMSGFYSLSWMPDISGKYTVIATFAGSDSYYTSYSETAFVVDEAPQPTPPPDPTPAPMTDTYVLGMGAAALVAIVLIGLVLIMMMRKK